MANGTITNNVLNGQYRKITYSYGGSSYSGIHIFQTLTKGSQSIAPAISESKIALSSINPAAVTATKVVAKTNACMFNYSKNEFYGFFYQGAGLPFYASGQKFTSTASIIDGWDMMSKNNTTSSKQYWPCFCVKTDGSAAIHWFYDAAALKTALPYCKCVIASVHPLVFGGKCVLNERVYDSESSGSMLICDPQNLSSSSARFRGSDGIPSSKAVRTLLGHRTGSDGIYSMVCTDSSMTIKTAANLMQDLGCDYAVAMDGGTPVEMRIKTGFGANGKVTANSGANLHTAVCAHQN